MTEADLQEIEIHLTQSLSNDPAVVAHLRQDLVFLIREVRRLQAEPAAREDLSWSDVVVKVGTGPALRGSVVLTKVEVE